MKVVEKFVSINGEGQRAGELAAFIRFAGCNLNCSYCDTKWANEYDIKYEENSITELVNFAVNSGVKNITLTGGEPLLQDEIYSLIKALRNEDFNVEVETNGAVDIANVKAINGVSVTIDFKTPSSGMEKFMLMGNYDLLTNGDTVKFVCGSAEDLEKAKHIIDKYCSNLIKQGVKIYFSPVFGNIEAKDIVAFMIKNNMVDVRLQLQLHKFIWQPDKRGV